MPLNFISIALGFNFCLAECYSPGVQSHKSSLSSKLQQTQHRMRNHMMHRQLDADAVNYFMGITATSTNNHIEPTHAPLW